MTNIQRIALLVILLSLQASNQANAIIIIPDLASASSYVSPGWATFEQPYWLSPRSGDDGVDRAIRTYFVFNIGNNYHVGDIATISLMQTAAVIEPLRPNGVPLIMKVFQANQLGALTAANMSTLWSATGVYSTSYSYPVSASSAMFSIDITPALSLSAPDALNPFVWVSIEISNPSNWFPSPNRNWVQFDQFSNAHNITIIPEPSTIGLLIISGFLLFQKSRKLNQRGQE
jgi:hypothetical protein